MTDRICRNRPRSSERGQAHRAGAPTREEVLRRREDVRRPGEKAAPSLVQRRRRTLHRLREGHEKSSLRSPRIRLGLAPKHVSHPVPAVAGLSLRLPAESSVGSFSLQNPESDEARALGWVRRQASSPPWARCRGSRHRSAMAGGPPDQRAGSAGLSESGIPGRRLRRGLRP